MNDLSATGPMVNNQYYDEHKSGIKWPLLLTWFNFKPSMDK